MKSILTALSILAVSFMNSVSARNEPIDINNLNVVSVLESETSQVKSSVFSESNEANLNGEVIANKQSIQLSQDTINFESLESQSNIMLTSNCNWTIESNVDWLVPYPNSGKNTADILFVAQENQTATVRVGTILVMHENGQEKTIRVIQNAKVASVLKTLNTSSLSPSGRALEIQPTQKQASLLTSASRNQTQCFYPNPSKGDFTIRGMHQAELSIYSMNGKCIYQAQVESDNALINTDLAKGIYLLNIEHKGKIIMEKLIIDK